MNVTCALMHAPFDEEILAIRPEESRSSIKNSELISRMRWSLNGVVFMILLNEEA